MENVNVTSKAGLCVSCGMCRGICTHGAIDFVKKNGVYTAAVDESKCSGCGLCVKVCPGLTRKYEGPVMARKAALGEVKTSVNAWSADAHLRHVCASGGVVTTLVKKLLDCGRYDVVFSLEGYDYSSRLKTVAMDGEKYSSSSETAPKSRYLPVSHENAVKYIKEHRDARVIIIGTPCAIHGITRTISLLKLNRENYLLIGLFCDKVLTHNMVDFYSDRYGEGKAVKTFHFKNKDSGGWPGDSKLVFGDGSETFVGIGERMKVKNFFLPERCLYCIDKLNAEADISLGDNYTKTESTKLGSNSVVIRTERGEDAWNTLGDSVCTVPVEYSDIVEAQDMNWRLNNLRYAKLYELRNRKNFGYVINDGITDGEDFLDYEAQYDKFLRLKSLGDNYGKAPEKLVSELENPRKTNAVSAFVSRARYFIRRKIFSKMK